MTNLPARDPEWERKLVGDYADYNRRLHNQRLLEQRLREAGLDDETLEANEAALAEREAAVLKRLQEPQENPWLTLSSLLDEPEEPVDWLIEGLLIKGGISVLGAKPKVGKTTLLHQLALAVSRGTTFLGRRTEPGAVIYLAIEEHRGQVVSRFRGLGATNEDQVQLLLGPPPEDPIKLLRQAVQDFHAALAIIDPIQRLTRLEDVNDYSQVSNATEPLIAIARETDCSFLFSHHLGKMEREGADQLIGSTALFGAVDTAFIMRRRQDNTRTIETIQRYGEDMQAQVLGHDVDSHVSWIAGSVEEHEQQNAQAAILEALRLEVEPVSETNLEELTGIRTETFRLNLRLLVQHHKVLKIGSGKRGDPYRYLYRSEQAGTSGNEREQAGTGSKKLVPDVGNKLSEYEHCPEGSEEGSSEPSVRTQEEAPFLVPGPLGREQETETRPPGEISPARSNRRGRCPGCGSKAVVEDPDGSLRCHGCNRSRGQGASR